MKGYVARYTSITDLVATIKLHYHNSVKQNTQAMQRKANCITYSNKNLLVISLARLIAPTIGVFRASITVNQV